MINEKLLFVSVICFSIFLSLTVNATMTDGNYVMIAYDITGSGEATITDANYILLASAGETATAQTITDENYNAGIGFYGSTFPFLVEIVEEVIEAAKTILVILPMAENSWIGIILLAMIAGFALFYVITKKKGGSIKGNKDEYVVEEEEESEEDGEAGGDI